MKKAVLASSLATSPIGRSVKRSSSKVPPRSKYPKFFIRPDDHPGITFIAYVVRSAGDKPVFVIAGSIEHSTTYFSETVLKESGFKQVIRKEACKRDGVLAKNIDLL